MANYPGSDPAQKTDFNASNTPSVEGHTASGHNNPNKEINAIGGDIRDTFAAGTEVSPDATAATLKARIGQILQQIKNITGEGNWYSSVAASISTIWAKFSEEHSSAGVHNGGMLKEVRIYTSNTTWTKPSGLKFVVVESVGGGGGGGAGNTNVTSGSGGGGGGYVKEKIAVGSLGATETVTIGAKGVGSDAGSDNATAGGNSTFGSHHTAGGGGAGVSNGMSPSNGGSAADGDLNIVGGSGAEGGLNTGGSGNYGGSSMYGFGVRGNRPDGGGSAATDYGAGGGGGNRGSSNKLGGNGSAGIIIVNEYF